MSKPIEVHWTADEFQRAVQSKVDQQTESLRAALLHLAQRTHPHSDGCDGCRRVQKEIRAAQQPSAAQRQE